MKKISKNIKNAIRNVIVIVIVMVVIGGFAAPVLAADAGSSALQGLKGTADVAGLKQAEPAAVIGSIIGYALSFIGVIFMVLVLYGGYMWMTSYGNTQKVDKAKELIIGAVIGLVIVVAAYTITNFVVSAILGSVGPATP